MKIIYIFVQSMKLNTETCLHLYCFFLFCFAFLLLKVIDFYSKAQSVDTCLILAFLGAVIHLNFISCPNWWKVILLYSSSIKLFSGTSASLWFAGSSLKHALICFFCVSVMPSSQWTAFLLLYALFSLLQSFMASCLCSRRRRTSRAAPSRETQLNVTLWC